MWSGARWAAATLLMAMLVIGGCEREGPAEQAGEDIDEAVEQAGEKAEELGNEAGEQTEEAKEELQQ